MEIRKSFLRLLAGKNLSESQSYQIFRDLFQQKISFHEAKALLLLMANRGETAEEVTGCLKALRSLEPPTRVPGLSLIDTCGTGGDGSNTLNVSTLSALVIAGAGGKVAKHGNRAVSSKCGSSDLLESFGVNLSAAKEKMIQSIRRFGIGYFHAPSHHPVFSRVQSLRKQLRVRTIFNLLGPLANPLQLDAHVLGVAKKNYVPLFAEVLSRTKLRRGLIVHSDDGLDEISISAPSNVVWVQNGKAGKITINPKNFGFSKSKGPNQGGDLKKNKALSQKLLQGRLKGRSRDIVVLNAAAGLVVLGCARNLTHGIKLAQESIDSGKAYQALQGLCKMSR